MAYIQNQVEDSSDVDTQNILLKTMNVVVSKCDSPNQFIKIRYLDGYFYLTISCIVSDLNQRGCSPNSSTRERSQQCINSVGAYSNDDVFDPDFSIACLFAITYQYMDEIIIVYDTNLAK